MSLPLDLVDIQDARVRIAPFIHTTPVIVSRRLDELIGAQVYFKCENFQRAGSFKARGAQNAVLMLDHARAARGVVTHSSGNHAAALAMAARNRGIPAHVVMPADAPRIKVESVRRLGGKIHFCDPNMQAREVETQALVRALDVVAVHSSDDIHVIAGQGTAMLEFLEQAPGLEAVLAPVGGGGLMAGTAIAARRLQPGIRIIATEPALADDAYRSWRGGRHVRDGNRHTVADGLRVTLGGHGFTVLCSLLDDFITVQEAAIVDAMRLVWEVLKIVIEPSSAVPLAALLQGVPSLSGRRIGIILSGGNVDVDMLPWQG